MNQTNQLGANQRGKSSLGTDTWGARRSTQQQGELNED